MIKQENVITKLLVRVNKSFKNISSGKTPGNDGSTKKNYETLSEDIRKPFINAFNTPFIKSRKNK